MGTPSLGLEVAEPCQTQPMPRQNRVSPLGEVQAVADRGLLYGNRGCLHDEQGRIRRPYAVRRWISCRLAFRGRCRTPLDPPGRYTGLYFLDEATAFAAGHRPCAECRRADYDRFGELWRTRHPADRGADAMDRTLHAERWAGRAQRRHDERYTALPDAAMVLCDSEPWLVRGEELLRWTPAGYSERIALPARGTAVVITPPALLAVLAAGWDSDQPLVHPSAQSPQGEGGRGTATSSTQVSTRSS